MAKQPQPERAAYGDSPAKRVKWLVDNHCDGNRRAFASKIGISHTAIANVVAEKSPPGQKLVRAIAERLNVSAAWLLTGEGEPFVGSAGCPPRGVPVSHNLLPGPPLTCPALLAGRWLDDAAKLFTPSQYWLFIEARHPVLRDRNFGFQSSDLLLIETDRSKFPAKEEMRGELCVCNQRVGKETKIVLASVGYAQEHEVDGGNLVAEVYQTREEDRSGWIKEEVYRTFPGGRIVHEERTRHPNTSLVGSDHIIQYADIVGVWMRLIRR